MVDFVVIAHQYAETESTERSSMGQIVDLREAQVGDDGPGGSIIDTCPRCGKNGIWLNLSNSSREAFAHSVDSSNLRIVEGCMLDAGGTA